jgi:hypothetical protein
MIFQLLSDFIAFTLEMRQFHLFVFLRFLSIQTTVTKRLYVIVDTYAKHRENPEHQYWYFFQLIYVNITVVN